MKLFKCLIYEILTLTQQNLMIFIIGYDIGF